MMMSTRRGAPVVAILAAVLALGACATLGIDSIVQPPRLEQAQGREPEFRLQGPGSGRPLGGATIRIWTRVENPNAYGLTLASLTGDLFLEGTRAADVSFPLGLPMLAGGDTIIPLDINVSFSDLPGLSTVVQRIMSQNRVAYRLDGTLTVDAGPFGQPGFGPTTWLRGESAILR